MILYGCFLGPEREPCTGRLVLENPIPDTTVAVGDTLFIDLANPPVFVSTEGEITYSYSVITSGLYINPAIVANPDDNNNFTNLMIIGLKKGKATTELKAVDGCLENSIKFNTTVIE
jgi:hypothetical protein